MLQVTDSVILIRNFGPNWYDNNLEEPFKTMVRQAVRKRGMNETAISTTALDAIDAEIQDDLVAFIADKGLPVKLVTMTVGRANPPDSIKHQRIETATQEQRIQTEKQTKLAEDQRMLAEQSRATADNAYREAMHLSPEQFIQLETDQDAGVGLWRERQGDLHVHTERRGAGAEPIEVVVDTEVVRGAAANRVERYDEGALTCRCRTSRRLRRAGRRS